MAPNVARAGCEAAKITPLPVEAAKTCAKVSLMLATSERLAAEVGGEMDGIEEQRKIAENLKAEFFDARKQFGIGLAEAVDGLHGVADDEAGAALAIGPCADEAAEQFMLASAGVLEFVDQQMANSIGDGLRGVDGKLVFALEDTERDLCNFSKVGGGSLGKDDAKLGSGAAQKSEAGANDLPFGVGVPDRS